MALKCSYSKWSAEDDLAMCVCPQTGQVHSYSLIHLIPLSIYFLASFLCGCLVGLLSLVCTPFSLSVSGWCVGACVCRPALFFGLLCLSLCVGCCLVCVRSCWCPVVLRVCLGLWRVLFFPSSVALCVFASVFWGCFGFSVPPLSCPPPRLVLWRLLVQSVFCWSLPPGIWFVL